MRMDRKKLLIVIILIAFGVIFQILIEDGLNIFKNKSYQLIDKKFPNNFVLDKKKFELLSTIDIINPAGNVFIKRSETNFNYINTAVKVFHKDKKEAEKIRKSIDVLFINNKDKLKIYSEHKNNFPLDRVRITFEIKLCDKTMLTINNSYGIVNALKIRSTLNITNKGNDIKLKDIDGKIFINKAEDNNVIIENCSDIIANFINSKATISKSSGNIEIFSIGGKIKIDSINNDKDIKIESKQSRISLSNVKINKINIKISYEDIFIKDLYVDNLDLLLKNSNVVIDPIKENNIIKTIINGTDAKILLKYKKKIYPNYTINLNYGDVKGNIDKLKITKNGHILKVHSKIGNPEIIINGKYTDVKINTI